MKRYVVTLAGLAALLLAGCTTSSTTLGSPTVPAAVLAEQTASDICAAVANGAKLMNDALQAAAQHGVISAAEYASIHAELVTVVHKNDAAIAAVQAAEATGAGNGWQADLQAVAAAAAGIQPAVVGLKNPSSQQFFVTSLGVFEAAVAMITNPPATT